MAPALALCRLQGIWLASAKGREAGLMPAGGSGIAGRAPGEG